MFQWREIQNIKILVYIRTLCLRGHGKANVGQQELRRKKRTSENKSLAEESTHGAWEFSDKGWVLKYAIEKVSNRKAV